MTDKKREEHFTQVFLSTTKEAAKDSKKKLERNFRRMGEMSPSECLALCFLIIRTVGDEIREKGGGDSAELAFMEILKQTTGKRNHDSNVIFQSTDTIPADIDKVKKAIA